MTTPDIAPITALEPKTKLTGRIVKTTLAGAIVDIGQELPGVIHISQLSKDPINKVEDVVQAGQSVEVWVRRVKKDRIELTMVEPLALEWKEIQPEMVLKGKVVRLESYGAFVDIGAERPGLIHVSELTHGYVKTASEVVKEGEEVEVKVLDVDRRKRQIRLSMKALQPEMAEEEKPEHDSRKPRGKRKGKKSDDAPREIDQGPSEPQLTAMQIAWYEALEKAKQEKAHKIKLAKSGQSDEREEMLNRTLEKRLPTGG